VKTRDKGKGITFALVLARLPFYYSVVLAKRWPLLMGMAL
jgi:hypothetical protein